MKINVVKWDITYRCNLDCLHCDRYFCRGKFKEMDTENALIALDRLEEMGIQELVLTGGEPLMRKDIFGIIEYARDKNMSVYLSTNGTLLTREISKKILFLGIKEIMISFDGGTAQIHDTTRGKGSFERVRNNSKTLSKLIKKSGSKTWLKMNSVLTAINLKDAEEFVNLAHETDFNELVLFYLMNWGNTTVNSEKLALDPSLYLKALEIIADRTQSIIREENYPFILTLSLYPLKIIKYLEEKYHLGWDTSGGPCTGGIKVIHMTPDGMVTPCDGGFHTVLAEREQGTSKFGEYPNILRDEVTDIMESDLFNKCILMFHNPRIYLETVPCKSCKDKSNCGICPTTVIQNDRIDLCIEVERIMNESHHELR